MASELRLYEDILTAGSEAALPDGVARAIYVSAGAVAVNGETLPADEGMVSSEALALAAGPEGATLWRFEALAANAEAAPLGETGTLRLAHAIDAQAIAVELLMRLDSVSFPPGGCALLHTHQGPGIRCLREGTIRIDTDGQSTAYGPGGPWFEAGPEPVFAQADAQTASRFIRAMVLPRTLLGASSIRYVNDEDRDKPKSQSYRIFGETPIDLS